MEAPIMLKRTSLKRICLFLVPIIFAGLLSGVSASAEKIVVAVIDDSSVPAKGDLYTMNADGADMQTIYHSDSGGIWDARISPDGSSIYFTSDYQSIYTPTDRNVFRIAGGGENLEQLTPSWLFGADNNLGAGTISGRVVDWNNSPIIGAPVYVEGRGMVSTGGDGRFRAENVPAGARVVLAYNIVLDRFDWTTAIVNANLESQIADLKPETSVSSKSSYSDPVVFGQKLYCRFSLDELLATPFASQQSYSIYKAEGCNFAFDFNGFDIGAKTGKTAIMDFTSGCPTNRGLYLGGADGAGMQLFLDMKAETPPGSGMYPWNGGEDVAWSPNENRLAITANYTADGFNGLTYLLVYDAATGDNTGAIYFSDTAYTLYNVTLHGWSPDGAWLLFSYWLNDPSQSELVKLRVNADGSIDPASMHVLLQNRTITGASWGELSAAAVNINDSETPAGFHLDANYPNPFNPETLLSFTVPGTAHVRLAVYDMLGKQIRLLLDENSAAGRHQVIWDGKNDRGEPAPSGNYAYHLEADGVTLSRRMTLVR